MTRTVYLNGRFVSEPEAMVSISDGGWLHGAGLFETMRAQSGRVFRLESHMRRLLGSAAKLLRPIDQTQLPTPVDFKVLMDHNELAEARLRMTVTAGAVRTGPEEEPEPELNICVTASELTAYPDEMYRQGIGVIVCGFRQSPTDPLAGHKTTSYLARLLALREAQSARRIEALWFTTNNELAEGSVSNVFIVSGGRLRTPSLDTPVLPGIARGAVIEAAGDAGIEVDEGALTIDSLLDADEVFLTNTIMQVMPVIAVERHTIGDGKVGAMTRSLSEAFCDLVRKECRQS